MPQPKIILHISMQLMKLTYKELVTMEIEINKNTSKILSAIGSKISPISEVRLYFLAKNPSQ